MPSSSISKSLSAWSSSSSSLRIDGVAGASAVCPQGPACSCCASSFLAFFVALGLLAPGCALFCLLLRSERIAFAYVPWLAEFVPASSSQLGSSRGVCVQWLEQPLCPGRTASPRVLVMPREKAAGRLVLLPLSALRFSIVFV